MMWLLLNDKTVTPEYFIDFKDSIKQMIPNARSKQSAIKTTYAALKIIEQNGGELQGSKVLELVKNFQIGS